MGYYEDNAEKFISSTRDVDMSELWTDFVQLLPPGCSVLDAGCGSGRDSLHFLRLGFQVTAFDLSPSMVESAGTLTGLQVHQLSFQEISWENQFDGIWANASLLHVPRQEMREVFSRLHRALGPEGILFCSYKNRKADFSEDGRSFTCYTPQALEELIDSLTLFDIITIRETCDRRPGKNDQVWTNAFLRKR